LHSLSIGGVTIPSLLRRVAFTSCLLRLSQTALSHFITLSGFVTNNSTVSTDTPCQSPSLATACMKCCPWTLQTPLVFSLEMMSQPRRHRREDYPGGSVSLLNLSHELLLTARRNLPLPMQVLTFLPLPLKPMAGRARLLLTAILSLNRAIG